MRLLFFQHSHCTRVLGTKKQQWLSLGIWNEAQYTNTLGQGLAIESWQKRLEVVWSAEKIFFSQVGYLQMSRKERVLIFFYEDKDSTYLLRASFFIYFNFLYILMPPLVSSVVHWDLFPVKYQLKYDNFRTLTNTLKVIYQFLSN